MQKRKRIVNKKLLEEIRCIFCLFCASLDPQSAMFGMNESGTRSHPHHLKTVGSGGDDVAENIIPLCVRHHQEIHQRGIDYCANKYKVFGDWLHFAGWQYTELSGWIR